MKNILTIILCTVVSSVLSGCLPTVFTGATASVTEFAKDRSAGETLTDARISANIKAQLLKNKLYSKVTIEVVQGRILLAGIVEKEEHKIKIVQLAWEQKDVKEVIDEMKVDENSRNFSVVQYTRDSMITAQVKSKIFVNRDIKFVNYTIVTISDVVYLFGIARSEEELEKVASIASNVHGAKQVVSHVKVQALANKIKGDNADVVNGTSEVISDEDFAFEN